MRCRKAAIALYCSLCISLVTGDLYADEFPDSTLPTMVVRMRGPQVEEENITIQLLTSLLWKYFDATNFHGYSGGHFPEDIVPRCDSAHIHYSLCAWDIQQYHKEWADTTHRYWFRYAPEMGLFSDSCFARSDSTFQSIADYSSADTMFDSENKEYSLTRVMGGLAQNTRYYDYLWFFEVYDEAPSKQWSSFKNDTSSLDDYIPNMYTQDTTSSGMLSMEEIEPAGVFSWQKWLAEHDEDNPVTMTLNYGLFHSIEPGEYLGLDSLNYGDMATQGRAIRAVMDAEFQPPPAGDSIPPTEDNSPEFICFDYYPFRYVDSDYDTTTTLCDTNWVFLIEHCEEGMDSTMMNAVVDGEPVPVYFYAQTIGAAAGPKMHGCSSNPQIDYNSYLYRNPTPQEFRMLCNLALLHQAKGIFPYSLCSYVQRHYDLGWNENYSCTALLDRHLIPFDAPYEEWVYMGRWPQHGTYDYSYVRPDSIPPWMDGFDPLYEIDAPPDPAVDPKYNERWYEWLFEPYGLLWNEIGGIMAGVKRIAPEMHDLWWCAAAYRDQATITLDAASQPLHFVPPRIKVFEDSAQTGCWLFYVDRFCRSNDTPYEIGFDPDSLPAYADCSSRLLDHSRRFVMDGAWDAQTGQYTFLDTLDGGESRLVEPFDPEDGLPADIRITEGDVRTIRPQRGDTVSAMAATAGNSIDILATFYNMGTEGAGSVEVMVYDSTESAQIGDTDTLRFAGLPYRPADSCRQTDSRRASFTWQTDSTDIGTHLITFSASPLPGEPNTADNSVDMTFLVRPRDYATAVREDPWDMTEADTLDWHTTDITAVSGDWDTSQQTGWTDSVSGMFEGSLEYDGQTLCIGDIGLAVPDTRDEYIDTDTYHMLSLGIVSMNPNLSDVSSGAIKIRWKEDGGDWSDWCGLLQGTDYLLGNGRDQWRVLGPIDLNEVDNLGWEDGDLAEELELSIRGGLPTPPPINPQPMAVRIGWVRLEESAQ